MEILIKKPTDIEQYVEEASTKYICPRHGELSQDSIVRFKFVDRFGKNIDHAYCLFCIESFLFTNIYLVYCKDSLQ